MIHPGPPSIDPNVCPDGLVLHVYAVPADRSDNTRFLFDRALLPNMDNIMEAIDDRERAESMLLPSEDALCLVIYDGDSGQRIQEMGWA